MKRLWARLHGEDPTEKLLRDTIDEAHKTIAFSFADVQERLGEIPIMPKHPGKWVQIAEGWRSKKIEPVMCDNCDLYMVNAKKGHTLVIHQHPQSETLHIISGRIRDIAGNRVYDSVSAPVFIPPNTLHGFEAQTDCTLVIKFHPPLGEA